MDCVRERFVVVDDFLPHEHRRPRRPRWPTSRWSS